ncbi:Solute carrier organic anion transporter family member 4C1 [Myotis davidii]|uniref:Solute carrier organic anion transporter family member 4C1 n=1 Tax=Myotis davidii TaxID=225400 RepID=L5MED9_MYODS|nr:Solute carrier organic anion transporter family member 4C1 [Myotis davidii]
MHIIVLFFSFYILGMVLGLIDVSLITFQKGIGLKTIENIVLSSSYDISSCLAVVFIAYYGRKGNILKWITVSSFLVGFGSLLFAFPYFHGENYQLDIETEDTCIIARNRTGCTSSSSSLSNFLYVFILGQLLLGAGGTPLYTLGTAFLDDSVPTHKSSLYIGAVLIPGAALGQILGGVIVSKLRMTCKSTMKFALLTSLIALVLSFVFVYANCENEPFAGVSQSYNGTGHMGNLTTPCNANCNCMRSHYYPVCGRDGVQYFSPCFAGCKSSVSVKHSEQEEVAAVPEANFQEASSAVGIMLVAPVCQCLACSPEIGPAGLLRE